MTRPSLSRTKRRAAQACALAVVLCSASQTHAGPWHVRNATNIADGQPVAVALRDDVGVAVAWDAGQLWLHEVAWSSTTVPSFDPAFTGPVTALRRPILTYDGTTALITSDAGRYLRAVAGVGNELTASTNSFALGGIALDPLGSGRGVCAMDNSSIPGFASLASTTNSGLLMIDRFTPSDLQADAVAVSGSSALAIAAGTQEYFRSTDLVAWDTAVGVVPPELSVQRAIATTDLGVFVVVGEAGVARVSADPFVSIDDRVVPGAPDLTALAFAPGTNVVFLGDATGDVHRVEDALAGPWVVTNLGATGLDAINGIAVLGASDVLVVGSVGATASVAWSNRPPSPPVPSQAAVALDEGVSVTLDASGTDPDEEVPSLSFFCDQPTLSVTPIDADSAQLSSSADPALCPGETVDLTCRVEASDGTAPAVATDIAVTLSGVDNDGDPVLTLVTVEDSMGVEVARLGSPPVTPVSEGDTLTVTLADATDDCPGTVRYQLFDLDDALMPVLLDSTFIPWGTPWTFEVPIADGLTRYRISVVLLDAGDGSSGGSVDFDAQSLVAPEVSLSCPVRADAGASFTATTIPTNDAPRDSLDWTTDLGTGVATGDAYTVTTDACTPGTANLSVTPVGPTRVGAPQSCAVLVDPVPTAPALSISEAPTLSVPISNEEVAITLHGVVADCPGEQGFVVWDVSALPSVLRAPESVDGVVTTAAPYELALTAELSALTELLGETVTLTAVAVDDDGSRSAPVSVAISFVLDEQAAARAAVDVALTLADDAPSAEGDLVAVTGRVSTDLGVALPTLAISLVDRGLAIVPDSASVTVACGGRGGLTASDGDGVLRIDGLRRGCPAQVAFLARRGLEPGGLGVTRCSFGTDNVEVSRCTGGLDPTPPPALSCAHARDPGPLSLLLALSWVLGVRTRSRARESAGFIKAVIKASG